MNAHMRQAYYTGSLAVASACDIIIAVALWHLLNARRSGIRRLVGLVLSVVHRCLIPFDPQYQKNGQQDHHLHDRNWCIDKVNDCV